MKVLVCGGRDYTDYVTLRVTLDEIHKENDITDIIHGAATGADTLAGIWCNSTLKSDGRLIRELRYPANWKKYGNAAGPIRNQKMINEAKPDLVVAFPGGTGTAHMVWIARAAGIKVVEIG